METYGALIDHVLALVESSLHCPLSLEDVSKATHLSPYHLHRVVRELSGTPLIDYLRRLRLSASLVDLLETKRRVIDIAQDYCS
jgi:AraC family transcriptional regulator